VPSSSGWTVETPNEGVDAEILAMPVDFRVSLTGMAERIEAIGLERMRAPHVKHLRASCGRCG
jgi:hypothetical protein